MKFLQKGFTLLEMLIVVGIISLLLGMGATSYSTAQKKARDAKRKGDLVGIKNALEQYYSVCGFTYPVSIASGIVCNSPATTFIASNSMPKDPKSTNVYTYTYTAATNTYTVCAPDTPPLESESTTPYCLSNQQ